MLMFFEFYKKKGNNSQIGREYFGEFVMRKMYEAVESIIVGVTEEMEERVKTIGEREKRMEGELRESRQLGYKEKANIQGRLEKLMQANAEMQIREQSLQEALQDIKLQKETSEQMFLEELNKEKSEHSKVLFDMRNKISQI